MMDLSFKPNTRIGWIGTGVPACLLALLRVKHPARYVLGSSHRSGVKYINRETVAR